MTARRIPLFFKKIVRIVIRYFASANMSLKVCLNNVALNIPIQSCYN